MTALLDVSPLWPADLHHIRIDSPDPATLAAFYARARGMEMAPLGTAWFMMLRPFLGLDDQVLIAAVGQNERDG